MLRLAKATVSSPHQQHHHHHHPSSNHHLEGSRACSTAGTQTLAVLQWACGKEVRNLWIMVRLLGASRPRPQQVGGIKRSPAKLLAGGTLHPTLANLQATNQWRAGVGRERPLSQPPVTPAGTRKMMAAEGSGTTLCRRETAPPSTPEAGVRLTEEREATSRVEEGTAG